MPSQTIGSNPPQPPDGGGQMPESATIIGVVVAVVTVLLVVSVIAVTVLITWKLRSSEGHNLSNPFHKRRGMYINSYYACVQSMVTTVRQL